MQIEMCVVSVNVWGTQFQTGRFNKPGNGD